MSTPQAQAKRSHRKGLKEKSRRRKRPVRLSKSEIDLLVRNLEEAREAEGRLGRRRVAQLAKPFGVAVESAYRFLRGVRPSEEERAARLTETERVLLWRYKGYVSQLIRVLEEMGKKRYSDATYYRMVRALPAWERAAMRQGDNGLRQNLQRIFRPDGVLHRGELWELDQFQMPNWTATADAGKTLAHKLWLTVIVDVATHKFVGHSISRPGQQPSRADVLRALYCAISRYGAPTVLRYDNALANLAADITKVLLRFRIIPAPVNPRDPAKKGTVERAILSIKEMFAVKVPFFDKGPRKVNGELYAPNVLPLPWKAFVARFEAFIVWFNSQHRHSALGKRTPDKVWAADTTELRMFDEGQLVWLLEREKRKVEPLGVKVENGDRPGSMYYNSVALHKLVGREIDVAIVRHCAPQVHLFHRGEWLGRGEVNPDAEAILEQRADDLAYLERSRLDALELEKAELLAALPLHEAARQTPARNRRRKQIPQPHEPQRAPKPVLAIHPELLGLRPLAERVAKVA